MDMSTLLYPLTAPRIQSIGTADNRMNIVRSKVDLSLAMHTRIIRKPRAAIKDIATSFKPKIHQLVPELKNLSDEDLEKEIGESSKFDFEAD